MLAEHSCEHAAVDVARDLRRLAGAEKRHRVKISRGERHAHVADAFGIDTELEAQAVFGAVEIRGSRHSDEALAAELVEDGSRHGHVSHFPTFLRA